MSQHQPNQPKNFDLKSVLMGGVLTVAMSIGGYFITSNLLQKNVEGTNLTQEELIQKNSFQSDYPEILIILKNSEYKLEFSKKGTTIQFPKTISPTHPTVKKITDYLESNKIQHNIGIPFLLGKSEEQISQNTEGAFIFIHSVSK